MGLKVDIASLTPEETQSQESYLHYGGGDSSVVRAPDS